MVNHVLDGFDDFGPDLGGNFEALMPKDSDFEIVRLTPQQFDRYNEDKSEKERWTRALVGWARICKRTVRLHSPNNNYLGIQIIYNPETNYYVAATSNPGR